MNDKHLDAMLSMANLGAPLSMNRSFIDFEARGQAAIDLWDMQTQITAEALLGAGWEAIPGAIDWYRRVRPDPEFFDVYIGPDPSGVVRAAIDTNDTGVPEWLDGLRTMYDLSELMRIHGCQP